MYSNTTEGGFMKKLICIFMCMLVLIGCSAKKNSGPITDISNQPETGEDTHIKSTNKPDYDTYSAYIGVRNKEGAWYYDVPYLNEVPRGYGMLFLNGDDYFLAKVGDYFKENEVNNLEEAKDVAIDMFLNTIDDYIFYVDENGFIEASSSYEIHSGMEMLKIEGTATDAKYKEVTGECWIYGYIFILDGKTIALMGMNERDKTEETKDTIRTYVDDMANSLVYKSY